MKERRRRPQNNLFDIYINAYFPGPPSRPTEFHHVELTSDSAMLEWRPGFDGGAAQTFTLEIKLKSAAGQRVRNSTGQHQ